MSGPGSISWLLPGWSDLRSFVPGRNCSTEVYIYPTYPTLFTSFQESKTDGSLDVKSQETLALLRFSGDNIVHMYFCCDCGILFQTVGENDFAMHEWRHWGCVGAMSCAISMSGTIHEEMTWWHVHTTICAPWQQRQLWSSPGSLDVHQTWDWQHVEIMGAILRPGYLEMDPQDIS